METNRFIQIMIMQLSSKILKLEEKLETHINTKQDIDVKIKKCRKLLRKITQVESEYKRFMSLISVDENKNI